MMENRIRGISGLSIILTCIFLLGSPAFSAKKLVLLKDIKPTHIETEDTYVPLELVKEIEEEIDDEHFFVKPMTVMPADDGSFFAYDMRLLKIFKFDKDFNLVKVFLKTGQGPSEILRRTAGFNKLYFTKKGFLNVAAPYNKKIIVFNRQGNFVKDIRIPFAWVRPFSPVMDKAENIYIISGSNPGIDVLDKNGTFKYTLLNADDYNSFIIHKPEFENPILERTIEMHSDSGNTKYDVLEGNRLFIYVTHASTLYVFKEKRLEKKYHIWPEKALEKHRLSTKRLEKKLKSKNFSSSLFDSFFVDKDDEANFYLSGHNQERNKKKVGMIYQFDLDGKLVNVFYADRPVRFCAQRHNLFYGVYKESVLIYKIKKQQSP
jgi:hypothetical protein